MLSSRKKVSLTHITDRDVGTFHLLCWRRTLVAWRYCRKKDLDSLRRGREEKKIFPQKTHRITTVWHLSFSQCIRAWIYSILWVITILFIDNLPSYSNSSFLKCNTAKVILPFENFWWILIFLSDLNMVKICKWTENDVFLASFTVSLLIRHSICRYIYRYLYIQVFTGTEFTYTQIHSIYI